MPTPETDAVRRAIDRLEAERCTITAAAAAEGIARSTLIRALRRRGIEPRLPATGPRKAPVPLPEPYYFADGSPLKS